MSTVSWFGQYQPSDFGGDFYGKTVFLDMNHSKMNKDKYHFLSC